MKKRDKRKERGWKKDDWVGERGVGERRNRYGIKAKMGRRKETRVSHWLYLLSSTSKGLFSLVVMLIRQVWYHGRNVDRLKLLS